MGDYVPKDEVQDFTCKEIARARNRMGKKDVLQEFAVLEMDAIDNSKEWFGGNGNIHMVGWGVTQQLMGRE